MSVNLEFLFDNLRALARITHDCAIAEVVIFTDSMKRADLDEFAETRIFDEHEVAHLKRILRPSNCLYPETSSLDARLALARCLMSAPLLRDASHAIGMLIVADSSAKHLSKSQFRSFECVARCVTSHYELHGLAMEDALTGALSRRGFEVCAEIEIGRFVRYERPASMVMLDLDYFKKLNDKFGHSVGDEVLQKVASTCFEIKRVQDRFARLGGEEFALILPETSLKQAVSMAERLRTSIAQLSIIPESTYAITASFGVKALDLRTSELATWLRECDKALYRAKSNGRDQVQAG